MPAYVKQLTDALIGTLERAATLKPHRLAGYVANVDFWADEIDHRLKLLDGWKARRERMIQGMCGSVAREIQPLSIEELNASTDWQSELAEIGRLRAKLVDTAKQFLGRCFKEGLISGDKLVELEDRLGFRV